MLLLLLSLTITSPVESQILPIFKCSSVLQTASCNELSEEVIRYGCNNDTQCMQCSAQCDFIYPNGTRCPSNDCTIGLCSAYVSLTHYAPTASCIESYGSDYCSFCELCAPSVFDSGSNNGTGIIDALCESNYLHLFCRILPQGADCINGFGNTVCSYCEATQTLCSPLSLNNLTPTQEDTLCTNHASLCALYNNELFCNLSANATLCAYCQYTLNNSICLPSPNCSTSNALVCRLLNSDDGCVDRYSSDFCFECLANYSACDVINRGGLSASQRASLCESETASSCQTALMQTNCSSVYSSYTCDYCDATQDTCRYIVDFGNSTIACNSEEIAMCAIDYGFFPCFLLNSTSYCSDCGNSLSACQYIYDPELIPPVCDRQSFLSLCSYFLTTVASFSLQCPQVFSNYTCSICQYSPIRCFDRGNSADGQALLCSNDSIAVCTDVVYPNGSCLRNDSEIDCDFCLLQHLTCDGINGTNNGSTMTGGNGLLTCETFEALYCQLIASDLSSCHLKYEDIVCNECVQYVTQCGSLNANNLTQDQLNILCIQKQVPYCELAIITNSSSFCGDDLDCSYCFATEGICHSFSNETLKICSNTSIVGDCNDYLYYPCYSFNEPDLCNTCKSIIMACPNIVYNPSYVPQSICTNTEYLSFCSQIIQQDCQQIYGYHACNYCQNINVTCPSVSSSSILSSFNQFCLNDADKCNQLLSSVPYSQCNATYTDLDCSFCSLLQLYCNESNNDIPCTKEFIFFCSAAYNDVNCSTTYSADTCQNCKNYLKRCPTIENGNLAQFCVSDASISTCGAYPYGVGCRPYFQSIDPDLMIICDFCSFYGTSCHDIICNEEDRIVQQCSSIITYGVSPTFIFNVATLNVSNDTAQCLPCSAAYAICLIGNVTINGTSIIDTSGSGDSGETEISLSSINIGSTTQYVLSSISSSDAIVTSFTIPDISSAYINTVLLNVTSTVTDITTPVVITSTIINTAITNSTFGISSTVVTTIVDASSTIDITSTVDVTFTTDISSLSFSKVDYFVTLTPTISTIIASSSVSYSAEITSHSLTTARISTTSTFPVTTSPFDTIASSTALSTTSTPAQTTSSTSISTISYTSTTQTAETTPTSTPAQTTSSTSISTISYTSTTQTAETTPTSGAPLPTETPTVPVSLFLSELDL